jgi:dTDP-4-dehydrorhamnose reductase
MRLLITGAGGMLGGDVAAVARGRGHEVVALTHSELDITATTALGALLGAERPDAVVNCAAWTDVDGAESHEDAALALNADGAGQLAKAASAHGAQLLHLSTDYVFDGTASSPYRESDEPAPRSAYGRTKLAGEGAVLAADPGHAVVRTAWLFGARGKNFVATMLAAAAGGREEVAVVTDQVGCPTFTGHLAAALIDVAERRTGGIQHIAGAGQCSWYEFTLEIFSQADVRCRVRPVLSDEFPRPAPRPAWSVLESERPEVPRLAPWQDGLAAYLAEVRTGLPR